MLFLIWILSFEERERADAFATISGFLLMWHQLIRVLSPKIENAFERVSETGKNTRRPRITFSAGWLKFHSFGKYTRMKILDGSSLHVERFNYEEN